MKHLFVDSNLFFQCKDLSSLPWKEISGNEEVLLLIPVAVQREIDALKSDGNKRRAKRARAANTLIRDIIISGGKKLLRTNPQTEITFPEKLPPIATTDESEFLDRSKPDDAIMLELLAYREKYPDSDAAILTHDTNPLLTAKHLKVPFEVIPDSWLLDPENDDKDKKINHLEQQIKELLQNSPIIELSAYIDDVEQPSLTGEIIEYPELTKNEIDTLIDKIKQSNPIKTNFEDKPNETKATAIQNSFFAGRYTPATHEEITKYTKETYPKWLNTINKSLGKLPTSLNTKGNIFEISFKLKNSGTMPANNLLIRFSVSENLLLLVPHSPKDDNKENKWSLPTAPTPPTGSYTSALDVILNSAKAMAMTDHSIFNNGPIFNDGPIKRDRSAFYWKPRRPIAAKQYQELECDEFPHKIQEEIFNLRIIAPDTHKSTGGLITCTVSAKNLKEPVELTIPVKLSFRQEDTFKVAKNLITN